MPLQTLQFQPDHRGPLHGIRVLELSRLMSGNMMTLQFGDFGVEVIKIEPPGAGDTLRHWKERGLSVWWMVYARNKKSVTLNPRHPSGVQLLARLIPSAHVLVESFRPGVLEAMGMSPEALWKINPKLVVVRISGWGKPAPTVSGRVLARLLRACPVSPPRTAFPISRRHCPTWAWPTCSQA